MMCGQRWPIVSEPTQATVKETAAEQMEETDSAKNSRKKACRNCGRIMTIPGDGLCGGCYGAVKGKFTKGTPEYDTALAQAKIKLTDPNFKPGNNRRGIKQKKNITKNITTAATSSSDLSPNNQSSDLPLGGGEPLFTDAKETSEDKFRRQPQSIETQAPICDAIVCLKAELHKNNEKRVKLLQAIEILSEL
jgi:hypothetical protein